MDMFRNKDGPGRKMEAEDGENKGKILEADRDPAPADKEDQRDAANFPWQFSYRFFVPLHGCKRYRTEHLVRKFCSVIHDSRKSNQ